MAEKIKCPRCNGEIRLWFPYWEDDPDSIPVSELHLEVEYEIVDCGFCDGTGEVDPDSDRFCEECNGTGEDSEGYECSACSASGICWEGDWEDTLVRDTGDD